MYANYEAGGERRLGFFDGETMRRLFGPATDDLVTSGFPEVPSDAPVEREPHAILPAMLRPGKILCLLRSYRAHAEELGNQAPSEPMYFAKLNNTLLGSGRPIRIPEDLDGEVHHEGELALVIGKGGRRIPPEDGLRHVAAYTVANDVTARTLQKADAGRNLPWLRGKSIDTFLPLGPGLVPANRVSDPHDLELLVTVNGLERQRGHTSRLMWPIGVILSHVSRWIRLDPGDVILTGTPEGVGPLRPGDEVVVEIPGLGRLVNSVE
jgi:2-keto-4-pentenoate hydratase/2-oxohepta-3-ene-1,7-dioic acid hydratase in catechol pathway